MSYSRWSYSCWYTYSDANQINGEPTLNVECEKSYPLSMLIQDKQKILSHYRDMRFERNPLNYKGEGEAPKDHYTENEIQELGTIIDRFIEGNKSQDPRGTE